MENTEKKKIRFNGIDLLIVFVILACIVGILIRAYGIRRLEHAADTDTVNISFKVSGISDTSGNIFVRDDIYYIVGTERIFGQLTDFETKPTVALVEKTDGTVAEARVPGQLDVLGVFSAEGEMTDAGFLLGGVQYIYINQIYTVESKQCRITLTVTDITVKSAEGTEDTGSAS